MNGLRIIVCGGRAFSGLELLYQVLDSLHKLTPVSQVIEGGAIGADQYARYWARDRGIECKTVKADWAKHLRAAGPIRNTKMLTMEPHFVVAFPGGAGTADMIRQARKAGVAVQVVK